MQPGLVPVLYYFALHIISLMHSFILSLCPLPSIWIIGQRMARIMTMLMLTRMMCALILRVWGTWRIRIAGTLNRTWRAGNWGRWDDWWWCWRRWRGKILIDMLVSWLMQARSFMNGGWSSAIDAWSTIGWAQSPVNQAQTLIGGAQVVFESPIVQPEKDRNWTGPVGRLQPGTGCGCLCWKMMDRWKKTGCNRSFWDWLP